jgi:hypothetical protein
MRMIYLFRFAGVALALVIASFITFPSFPNTGRGKPIAKQTMMVDRTLKGDRLLLREPSIRPREFGLPVSPQQKSQTREKIPVGCDAAFSPVAAPQLANVFRRCAV